MIPYLRNIYINATAEIVAIVILSVILISSLLRKKETPSKKPFCVLTAFLILLLTESAASWILDGVAIRNGTKPVLEVIRHILIVLDYMLYAILDDLFFLYLIASVVEKRSVSAQYLKNGKRIFSILFAISILCGIAFATSLWTGWFFTVNAYGAIECTAGYWVLTAFAMLADYTGLAVIIKNRKALGKAKTVSCLVYLFVPVILVIFDVIFKFVISYVSIAIIVVLIFITVDIRQDRELMERETEAAKLEAEKTEMKVNLMMSQIQPHFLYNSLSSIACLCRKDPKEAENAVNEFSDYLRMNLRFINTKQTILFETELNHVENYLNIQKRRFPKQLKVEYDIKAKNFRLPALTVQPIVENAVKYGVESRFETTTICISSEEMETAYIIRVYDDGPGFDIMQTPNDDRPHIGIASVKSRLANTAGGTMQIQSGKGSGTTVTITIPKEAEDVRR